MKIQEFKQLKELELKELWLKVKTLKIEIADLTLDKNMKKLKDLKAISKKKKEGAQILTVMKQKELLAQLESKVNEQGSVKETKMSETVGTKARKEKTSLK